MKIDSTHHRIKLYFYSATYNMLFSLLPYSRNITHQYVPHMANNSVQLYHIVSHLAKSNVKNPLVRIEIKKRNFSRGRLDQLKQFGKVNGAKILSRELSGQSELVRGVKQIFSFSFQDLFGTDECKIQEWERKKGRKGI